MSSDKQKKLMEMVIKEDKLWIELRDIEEEMRTFIVTALTSESDSKEHMKMIMICMKVCLSKSIIEEDMWEPKEYTFDDFLQNVYPFILNYPNPTPEIIENIRKEIWGYIVYNLPSLLDMAEDYMKDISDADSIENIEEKSMILYTCVFVAYMETSLRKMEFAEVELPGE